MKTELLQNVLEKIADAAKRGDLREVERLTPVASRVRELIEQQQSLEKETEELAGHLSYNKRAQPNGTTDLTFVPHSGLRQITRRATRGGLCVEIDLPGAGRLRIQERTAAETMVVLMERLLASLGATTMNKLERFRVSRGPLLSKQPRLDFKNSSTNETYAHHRIPGTDLYVLTHSSTAEKIARLKEALLFIGLPQRSFRVYRSD
jgi:hypothetical protein